VLQSRPPAYDPATKSRELLNFPRTSIRNGTNAFPEGAVASTNLRARPSVGAKAAHALPGHAGWHPAASALSSRAVSADATNASAASRTAIVTSARTTATGAATAATDGTVSAGSSDGADSARSTGWRGAARRDAATRTTAGSIPRAVATEPAQSAGHRASTRA